MKTETILKNSIITGIFLIPFVPLFVSSSMYFPYITGKAFFFRIIVEIITALWLILALRNKKYMPQFSWITIALTIFTFVVLIADLSGMNPHKSLWSNFERMEGWVTIVHLWLYYLVTSSMLLTVRVWERLINTSIGASFILVVYGFAQLLGAAEIHQGSTRVDASLGNAAYFAVYLLIHIFLSLFMMYRKWSNRSLRWIYGIMAALQLIILYNTGTRGSILGLIGAVLVSAFIVTIVKRNVARVRNIGLGIIVAILLLIGGFQAIKGTAFVQNSEMLRRLASINLSDAAPRLAIWNMALEGFKERPILGWGQENFNYVFNENYKPSMYAQEQWFDRAHNVFFDWLIAAGIVGLLSYLSLFGTALWYVWKKESEGFDFYERVIFTGLLTAYFIHNLFVFDHLVSYILFITVLSYIHVFGKEREFAFLQRRNTENVAFYATPLIIVVAIVALYFVNIRPINASQSLILAITPQQEGGQTKNLNYFKKALAYNTLGTQEMREQLASVAINAVQSNADESIKREFLSLANRELQEWVKESPMDARAHLFYGSFLARVGSGGDAEKHYEKAVELSPNKQTILFELGSQYLSQGKTEEALAIFKRAYESEKNYDQAKLMYAIAAVYAGDEELSESLLASLPSDVLTDSRLINAYAATKNFAKVTHVYTAVLEDEPANTQVRASLAAAYLMLGNKNAAIRELEKAIELDPNFKTQGQYFISEIRAGRNPAQ